MSGLKLKTFRKGFKNNKLNLIKVFIIELSYKFYIMQIKNIFLSKLYALKYLT